MTKTAEEIIEDAKVEAAITIETAQARAIEIENQARLNASKIAGMKSEKEDRVKKPDYKMETDGYSRLDLVQLKASEKAKFHVPGAEVFQHGEPAEKLIQIGECEFVSIKKKSAGEGKHAIFINKKPKPVEAK